MDKEFTYDELQMQLQLQLTYNARLEAEILTLRQTIARLKSERADMLEDLDGSY